MGAMFCIAETYMTNRTETLLEVLVTPEHGQKRRYRYHRRQTQPGYWRTEYEWNGCLWRIVGREALTDLVIRESPRTDE